VFLCNLGRHPPDRTDFRLINLGIDVEWKPKFLAATTFQHERGENMAQVKAIPDGYHNVTPYLFVRGAAAAIEFYKTVFGATEILRMPGPDGRIAHAEIKIGDSIVMLADENPGRGVMSPQTIGGYSAGMMVYIENVDAVVKKAIERGARALHPIKDQFYGDRSGSILDPFGHMWTIATHVEDVSEEELKKRMSAMSHAAGS
jgi:PhnB protein